jgi:hypothetical protein
VNRTARRQAQLQHILRAHRFGFRHQVEAPRGAVVGLVAIAVDLRRIAPARIQERQRHGQRAGSTIGDGADIPVV